MATLALALVTGLTPVASASHDSGCQTVQPTSIPIVNVPDAFGEAKTCDRDGDGAFDTVEFDTETVPVDGVISVTHEEKRRADHRDSQTQTTVRISPTAPTGPTVYHEAEVEDDQDDGQIDRTDTRGGLESTGPTVYYRLFLLDEDDDGQPDGYGFVTCVPHVNCRAPGPHLIPDIPDRVDLPDITL